MKSHDIEQRRELGKIAAGRAQEVLRVGDRVRVTKCPGTKRVITFAGWSGQWMVSKSGMNDFHPINIDQVNGVPVDFTVGPEVSQ